MYVSMSLRRADHSSRGVLLTVVRRWVWSRNFVNEEALAHWGAVAPKGKKFPWSISSPSLPSSKFIRQLRLCVFSKLFIATNKFNIKRVPNIMSTTFHTDNLCQFPSSPNCNFVLYLPLCYLNHANLTLRWLMSYIYGAPILDVSRSHTTTQHSR